MKPKQRNMSEPEKGIRNYSRRIRKRNLSLGKTQTKMRYPRRSAERPGSRKSHQEPVVAKAENATSGELDWKMERIITIHINELKEQFGQNENWLKKFIQEITVADSQPIDTKTLLKWIQQRPDIFTPDAIALMARDGYGFQKKRNVRNTSSGSPKPSSSSRITDDSRRGK